jgi:hypothetical protein
MLIEPFSSTSLRRVEGSCCWRRGSGYLGLVSPASRKTPKLRNAGSSMESGSVGSWATTHNRGRAPSTTSRRGWASPSKSNLTCRERDTGVFHTQERQVVCRVSESDQRREHHRHLFRPNNTGEPRAPELMSAWCFPLASRFPSSDRVPTPKFTPVVRAGGRRPASL